MKVERNSPARGTRSVAQTAYARRVEAAAGPANAETVDATASVLGIPEAEFTPKVRDAIMSLMGEVESLRRELHLTKIRLEDMEKAADQDGMLPLLNRRAFVRELTRYINMAGRYNMPVSLIYFDLNHLKKTNDTYGHAAGDAVLEHFAQVLSKNVRESDCVGRLGGDEFGVLLSATPTRPRHSRKPTAWRRLCRLRPPYGKATPFRSPSPMARSSSSSGDKPDIAMARADEAMYAHKRAGRSAAE